MFWLARNLCTWKAKTKEKKKNSKQNKTHTKPPPMQQILQHYSAALGTFKTTPRSGIHPQCSHIMIPSPMHLMIREGKPQTLISTLAHNYIKHTATHIQSMHTRTRGWEKWMMTSYQHDGTGTMINKSGITSLKLAQKSVCIHFSAEQSDLQN